MNRAAVAWGMGLSLLAAASGVRAEKAMTPGESPRSRTERATFAGGCFWCMEPPFERLDGVLSVTSGYTGGAVKNPTYQQVSLGTTGHAEAIEVVYDPATISYERLLDVFWMNVDPTDPQGQFADKGTQYRTAIFYHTEEQQRLAEASKVSLAQSGKFTTPIVTEIAPVTEFYRAEDYHQDYYKKNAVHYKLYRIGSGRERFLKRTWGDTGH